MPFQHNNISKLTCLLLNLTLILFFISNVQIRNVNGMSPMLQRQQHSSYYYHLKNEETPVITSGYGSNRYGVAKRRSADNQVVKQSELTNTSVDSGIAPLMRYLKPLLRRKRSTNLSEEDIRSEEVVDVKTASDEIELIKVLPSPSLRGGTTFIRPVSISKFLLKNCGTSKKLAERVVNGEDVEEGKYPWMAAILKNGDGWCGGTILNRNWIITASHCFMSEQNPKSYIVRVGSVNRNSGMSHKVKKIIMHGRFHLDNMFNSDIALMKLERPLKLGDDVNSICLPTTPFEEPRTTQLVIAGWGATKYQNSDLPVILQEVTLDRISDGNCAKRYQKKSNVIYKSQICTWTKKKDACQGDSGGPAIEIQNNKAFLIGIISYGSKCADAMPGVYTQVSYFLSWIATKIEEEGRN